MLDIILMTLNYKKCHAFLIFTCLISKKAVIDLLINKENFKNF